MKGAVCGGCRALKAAVKDRDAVIPDEFRRAFIILAVVAGVSLATLFCVLVATAIFLAGHLS